MFQQDGTPAHRARDTVAFLERDRERDARDSSSSKRLCPCTGYISSKNSDNFKPICHDYYNSAK